MKKKAIVFIMCVMGLFACRKEATQDPIVGKWNWVVQYFDNPDSSTPQSTGIQETLVFYSNHSYSLTQNGAVKDTGYFRLVTGISTLTGQAVKAVYKTNIAGTDTEYYSYYGNDTLFFCHDLIGTCGSGARYYVRG